VRGKNWHQKKKPFRPTAGLTDWKKRAEQRKAEKAARSIEKEMKAEKDAERQVGSPFPNGSSSR
jgi:rRNA-processing protein CGR1